MSKSLNLENFTVGPFGPEINIMIGCWYIAILMKEFDNDIDLVITAYNGGSRNVNTGCAQIIVIQDKAIKSR